MAYLKSKTYSEHCQTSTMKRFAKNSYLAHFSAQARRNKINPPQEISFILSGNDPPPPPPPPPLLIFQEDISEK